MSMLPTGSHCPYIKHIHHPNSTMDAYFDKYFNLHLRDQAAIMSFNRDGDFKYTVDASGFKPNELKIEVDGQFLSIRGDHKSENKYEMVHRSFLRSVRIPEVIDKATLHSELDDKGCLIITGKKYANLQPTTLPIIMKEKKNESEQSSPQIQEPESPSDK